MCGPSGQEKLIAGQMASFSNMLSVDFANRFVDQGQTLAMLGQNLQAVKEGKLFAGFDAGTLAAMNTEAINTTGANYANAARAVGAQLAGRGGDAGLVSGVDQQIKATLAGQAAGQLSKEQLDIQLANRAAQERNTAMVLGGEQTLAGLQSPLGYAGATTEAQRSAFGAASQIAQEQGQMEADIAGGVAKLAIGAATFGAGAAGVGGAEGGFGGGVQALANPDILAA